jgi:uncharacterized protein YneF (UPF0154 family)
MNSLFSIMLALLAIIFFLIIGVVIVVLYVSFKVVDRVHQERYPWE